MWGNRARSVVALGMLAQLQAAMVIVGCDNPLPPRRSDAGAQPQPDTHASSGTSAGRAAGNSGAANTAANSGGAGTTAAGSGGEGGAAGSTTAGKGSQTVPPQIDRGTVAANTLPDIDGAAYGKLIKQLNQFGLELGQRHVEADKLTTQNSIYSPLSVAIALSMTYAGARGATAAELSKLLADSIPSDVLHTGVNRLMRDMTARAQVSSGSADARRLELSIVDALFADRSLKVQDAFLNELAQNYDSGLYREDFANAPDQSRIHINDWVADKTHDRITELLKPQDIDEMTRFVIVNALYFYASWTWPFDEKETRDEDFHMLDGTTVAVPTMHQEESHMYARGDGFEIVDVSYVGSNFSMAIILPEAGKFEAIREGLTASWFDTALESLKSTALRLALPKFKVTSDTFSLKTSLIDMGMKTAFSVEADLSGITGDRSLRITDVLQKAFVAVTETGTEASAASAVTGGFSISTTEYSPLNIDRPFLFVIHDAVGVVLFSGQVVNPAG